MAHVLMEHKVKDYAAWKTVFDGHADMRKSRGEKSYRIFRPNGEANEVTLLFEWSSLKEAERFYASLEFKSATMRAGVIAPPRVKFLTEA
jgi:hypothetical protein